MMFAELFIIFLYVNYFHIPSIFVYDKIVILIWLIIFKLLYIHFTLIWKEERFTIEFICVNILLKS